MRRLWLLIKHLPADSALVRAVAPDRAELARWTATTYVLADLYDAYAITHAGRRKPPPYLRPGEAIRRRDAASRNDERLLERHRQLTKGT